MTDTTQGAEQAPDFTPVTLPADAPESMDFRSAARALQGIRFPKKEAEAAPADALSAPAAQEQESPVTPEDGAPQDAAPAEATESPAEPAELPPIEPPRSWSKDEKERFTSLPRDTQAYLAERETERDREIRRTQNEAAEKLKGLNVKEQAVEQARQQYESALPQLLQTLQDQTAGAFSDVKTIADVEKMAREDWPRYLQWDLQQKKIAATHQELQAAQQRQQTERAQKFSEFAKKEDALFEEKVPDLRDPEKAEKLRKSAVALLESIGFTNAELGASWSGEKDIPLRDHRMQLLIHDAMQWREAQAKAKAAVTRPVPPVQRPGVAPAKNAGAMADIQRLQQQLDNASGIQAARIAADLVKARRAAR
jgi:hypothetical protein